MEEISHSESREIKKKSKVQEKPKDSQKKSCPNSIKNCLQKLKEKNKLIIFISIGLILLIALAVILTIFLKKKSSIKEKENEDEILSDDNNPPSPTVSGGLPKEFDITTKKGDLKHISIIQKTKEDTKMSGKVITTEVIRKTNYDIYITSEEDAEEQNKNFYSKMYTGVVTIKSECSTIESDDCEPQTLIDLTKKSTKNKKNTRILESSEDFKDVPIALCLFNITDNHIITSLTCPESLPDYKRKEIILDLYFFRPPAAKRFDKENDNITISIKEDEETKRKYIRETNGGLCNVYKNLNTKCTTDMNTTLDSEGNLLTYDEEAITYINHDEKNSYIRNKVTNLVDNSQDIQKIDIETYNNSLNKLLPLMKPYMKEEIQFTSNDFNDLINMMNDKSKSQKNQKYIPKKKKNVFRNLDQSKPKQIQHGDLFTYEELGIAINLGLKIDPGLNSPNMGVYGSLIFDTNESDYSALLEESNIQNIIDQLSSLSKAGNKLASELYDKISDKLEQIPNEISLQINSLDELLMYYDISSIFNSTLSLYSFNKLPFQIIQLSTELISKLIEISVSIRLGNVRISVQGLSDNIYNYLDNSHGLIKNMLNNLGNLSHVLTTKNNTFTEITNYYLNNTSSSYVNIIQKMKEVLDNYYKNEYNIIYPKVQEVIALFEESTQDSLKKELSSLNDLCEKITNKIYSINNINNDQYQTVVLNFQNFNKYTNDIINYIKNYIIEIINIKENGYFTSGRDINIFNHSFISIISEADEIAKKLDNVNIIDKTFDEIMIKFRESYINNIKYMEQIKSGNFTFEEDVLNNTLFTKDEKNLLETEIKNLIDEILNKVKMENEFYIGKIKSYFDKFLKDNLDDLDNYIYDLNSIFSEEAIQDIELSFEKSLNLSLEQLTKDIYKNINLTKQYFDFYHDLIFDDNALKNILETYNLTNISNYFYYKPSNQYWFYDYRYIYQMKKNDEIMGKLRTSAYLSKYNSFMANLNYSEEYLFHQLSNDIINEYREIYTQIMEELRLIIDNKLSEKFPDFDEVEFFENHLRTIGNLKLRLNKYFSEDLFNKKYLTIINETIQKNKNLIDSTRNYINSKHFSIKNLEIYEDDFNDICIEFKRKVCYGCDNCAHQTYYYDKYCFILTPYEYNYINIIKISFNSVKNFVELDDFFSIFINKINDKIVKYNSILNYLNFNISYIKQKTLEENLTENYLDPINLWIRNILTEKYQNVLLKASYDYYKQSFEGKIKIMFSDIIKRWESSFTTLSEEISDKTENIKYSEFEFTEICEIYRTIIVKDLLKYYFDSIILFQRSELNYTISYYYNYFWKLVNKSYKYIIKKIPTNENDFNDILKERKAEIKNNFDVLTDEITNSEINYLSIEKQVYLLQTVESDFFKSNQILEENIKKLNETLYDINIEIYIYEHFTKLGNEFSLVMRFYLENKELGKLIEQYYEPVDKEEFFDFKLEKFKDVMNENWIFDTYDFINILNDALFRTNKEIKKELFFQMQNYTSIIENEINKFFDDNIENIINNLYVNQIKELNLNQRDIIYNNISDLIKEFEDLMEEEATRIRSNPSVYKLNIDYILQRMVSYKNDLYLRINSSLFDTLDEFYENVYRNVYINCIETKLEQFLNKARTASAHNDYKEYILLNSSYKIGEIIFNLTNDIINDYKIIVKKKIFSKYIEYYEKIKSFLDLSNIIGQIDSSFDDIYQNILLPELTEENNCTLSTCNTFDFKQETKNKIENIFSTKATNIKNQMLLTKGDNYQVYFPCSLDFTYSDINIITPLCNSLKRFLSFEKEEQIIRINDFIQNAIKSNLEDFLDNVIPSFGNQFFERIIDYNINFKIVDLYQNLYYALGQSKLYYQSLDAVTNKGNLPFDLKIRLYSLNDLDLTIEEKKTDIKNLLEKELSELISDLKNVAKETYTHYISQNAEIQNSFSNSVLEKIDNNLIEIMPDIEKKYQNVLEKYLKEKFMNDFSEILEEKSNDMLEVFNEEKANLTLSLDILFSSKEGKDLNEVNKNINKTLESIHNYKKFSLTFEITQETKNFFINYGNNTLLPLFKKFDSDLNEKTKELIINSINQNSLEIEGVNPYLFINARNSVYNNLYNNFINIINNGMNIYGDTESKYINNLYYYRDQNNNDRRRLVNIDNEAIKRIESKDVEETMNQLLNRINNTKNYVNNLNAFTDYEKRIENYVTNLSIQKKYIQEMINTNKYNAEVDSFLKEKLNNLTNILENYYKRINSSFYSLKTDLLNSIDNIYYSINRCKNITNYTLNNEYEKISNSINRINKIITNNIVQNKTNFKYNHGSDHMQTNAIFNLINITEYAEFNLDLILEGNDFKVPKVKAKIVGKTKPKRAELFIYTGYGFCPLKISKISIDFNEVNFTTTVEYDTKSSNINITTYTNFERYSYTKQIAVAPEISNLKDVTFQDLDLSSIECIDANNKNNIIEERVEVPAKITSNSKFIIK